MHNYIPDWLKLAAEGRIFEAAELAPGQGFNDAFLDVASSAAAEKGYAVDEQAYGLRVYLLE